jgi:hypothetical protein
MPVGRKEDGLSRNITNRPGDDEMDCKRALALGQAHYIRVASVCIIVDLSVEQLVKDVCCPCSYGRFTKTGCRYAD